MSKAMQAKKDPDEVVLDLRKLRHVKATDFLWTYSHIASIALTPYDVRFVFGEYDLVDPKNANVVDKVSVTVSPEHAKRIHRFLGEKLKEWEKQFGDSYKENLEISD